MSMKPIQQRGENDCVIAALASATGGDYDSVAAGLTEKGRTPDLWRIGRYLESKGFAYHFRGGRPEPFAPTHIVKVTMWSWPHFVAMDDRGRVFDPYPPQFGNDGSHESLDHPDFKEVFWALGIWAQL